MTTSREDAAFRYELDVDPLKNHIPANITEESSPIVQALQASITKVTVRARVFRRLGWRHGRPLLPPGGIDTVGYGPGGENAHGANEAVQIDDLVTQARVYVETITRMLNVTIRP